MRALAPIALLLICGACMAAERTLPIRAMDPLLGSWACQGVFPASGKVIASTMHLASELGGAGVLKRHDDLPPSSYRALEIWAYDAKTLQFRASVVDGSGGVRQFSASGWDGDTLTWTSAPDVQPAQKFVYVRQPQGTLRVDWQIMRDGRFVLGDTLTCKRQ